MWCGTVDAFIDLLSGRSVEATIALREAADPQPTGEAWERALSIAGDVQFGRCAPTYPTGDVCHSPAGDAPRVLPGEDEVHSSLSIAMCAEAPDLRQEIRPRTILCNVAAVQTPVASSRLNTLVVPDKSQVEAMRNDTDLDKRTPVPSVAKLTSLSAEMARSRGRPLGIRSLKE